MHRRTGRRGRAATAALAALALLLQAFGALLPCAQGDAAALPVGALVICTPEGIQVLGPDGTPLDASEGGAPAAAAEPCHACCLTRGCCLGPLAGRATAAFAPAVPLSFEISDTAAPHRGLPLAKLGRGPPAA